MIFFFFLGGGGIKEGGLVLREWLHFMHTSLSNFFPSFGGMFVQTQMLSSGDGC